MAGSGLYRIKVGILEGRHVPIIRREKVLVQCRFNGETLLTDASPCIDNPIWDTELVWELDGRSLRYMRTQRASLRLEVMTLAKGKMPTKLGFVILDLRTMDDHPVGSHKTHWMPLVHTKTSIRVRPELNVTYGIEAVDPTARHSNNLPLAGSEESKNDITLSAPLKPAPATTGKFVRHDSSLPTRPASVPPLADISQLQDIYITHDDVNACYLLSTDKDESLPKENWTFSASVDVAKNLRYLLPTSDAIKSPAGFYFTFGLLNHAIKTSTFPSLEGESKQQSLPAETFHWHLQSTAETFTHVLKSMKYLIIHLCNAKQDILGYARVPLAPFLPLRQQRLVQDVYRCQAQLVTDEAMLHKPVIGFSIKIESSPTDPEQSVESIPTQTTSRPKQQQPDQVSPTSSPPLLSKKPPPPAVTTSKTKAIHQYRCSLEFPFIHHLHTNKVTKAHIYLKYTYAPFGTHASVFTLPPTDVYPEQSRTMIDHTFNAFEFVMAPDRLSEYFTRVPLLVEVWHKEAAETDMQLGVAVVHLCDVFSETARKTLVTTAHGKEVKALRQVHERLVPIETQALSAKDASEKSQDEIGKLQVLLTLEDMGMVHRTTIDDPANETSAVVEALSTDDDVVTPPKQASPRKPSMDRQPSLQTMAQQAPPVRTGSVEENVRQSAEYEAALAIEAWKAKTKTEFEQALHQKEEELLLALATEWQGKESQRRERLARKLRDMETLEQDVKRSVGDLSEREALVKKQEEALQHAQRQLQQERQTHLSETRDASRRLHDEYKHQLAMSERKLKDQEDQISQLQQALQRQRTDQDALEASYQKLRLTHLQYREQPADQARKHDAEVRELHGVLHALRQDMANLQIEHQKVNFDLEKTTRDLAEARKSLHSMTSSKKFYKRELTTALDKFEQYERQLRERHVGPSSSEGTMQSPPPVSSQLNHLLLQSLRKDVSSMRQAVSGSMAEVPSVSPLPPTMSVNPVTASAPSIAQPALSPKKAATLHTSPLHTASVPTSPRKAKNPRAPFETHYKITTTSPTKPTSESEDNKTVPASSPSILDNLRRERDDLIVTGTYRPHDRVIQFIDQRIQSLERLGK